MNSKKIITYIVISMVVFGLYLGKTNASEYINYYNISMTNQEYNNLLSLGFNEKEIYYMSEETFENNKNLSGEVVSRDEKFYKTIYTDLNGNPQTIEITENEYNNQSHMDPRGTVYTEYKNMISVMTKLDNKFRYKVTLNWNNFPSVRGYDIIGIGFNDDVHIDSTLYYDTTYCVSSGVCTPSSIYNYRQITPTGGSLVFKLPSISIVALSSVLYYDVVKDNPSQTITRLDMYADYAHATSNNVTYDMYSSHLINVDGIRLGSYTGYYDAIPCAQSSWGGTW